MEAWHPNPDFFFPPGGGPILDLGPYYINNLVNLVGPVKRWPHSTYMASGPHGISEDRAAAKSIPVKTATNIHALLEFESGAAVSLDDQLGRVGATATRTDGALWHRGRDLRAGSELLRRNGRGQGKDREAEAGRGFCGTIR